MTHEASHLKIKGMHCTGCEETIEHAVAHLPACRKSIADYVKQTVDVEFDGKRIKEIDIRNAIEEKGYEFESASPRFRPASAKRTDFICFSC